MFRIVRPIITLALAIVACLSSCTAAPLPGDPLTKQQSATLVSAFDLMHSRGITDYASLGEALLARGIWRAADPNDIYIAQAEKGGDTPFAYTLSPGHKPIAIVLADRFFTQTTPLGRAAVMIHELGHYRAYVKTGRSTEYDGYKVEYDTYPVLGLSEKDGLVYFAMLDGTAEYVVPKDKAYAKNADLQQFLTN